MNFDSIPNDYSPLYAPAVYTIYDCNPDVETDVEVVDAVNKATLGVKRLFGNNFYRFNVAGYLRKACSVCPAVPYQKPAVMPKPSQTVKIEARMGMIKSPVSILIPSEDAVKPAVILSNGPSVRRIAYDEFDEISFIARNATVKAIFKFVGQKKTCEIQSNTLAVQHDMVTLSFCLTDMAVTLSGKGFDIGEFDSIGVTIYSGAAIIARQEYLLFEPNPNAVRIAWLNPLGAVDCYSFPYTEAQSVELERENGISDAGFDITHSVRKQTAAKIVSDIEPASVALWIAEIVSSPLVWVVKSDNYQRIHVIDKQAVIRRDTPARISFTYKPATAQIYQNML